MVFGYRSAKHASQLQAHNLTYDANQLKAFEESMFIGKEIKRERWLSVKQEIRHIMWEHVGIIRSKQSLQMALVKLLKFKDLLRAKPFSEEYKEIQNMLLLSLLITNFSVARKESRGCHYRTDFSNKNSGLNKKHYSQNRHQIKPILSDRLN